MKKMKFMRQLFIAVLCIMSFTTSELYTNNKVIAEQNTSVKQVQTNEIYTSSLAIVANPKAYLNKDVTMKAKFDKFATLGLDYKSAFRSSEKYISFLIKRDDTKYNIPLSEMKLFILRKEAEKFIDLKTDDEIIIKGKVFSDVLGDAWVDVNSITISKKAENNNGVK